ncbi:EAL domain-containing protein [Bosea sp. AAP35]|uniref:sensor domain-containing protein n=1 Tax=Bosea sp. AAP35 TaxID=1523417 RepID=UPI0006B9EA12|nr:EAL domain-containing protein [Bosea sp. AAP35]
MAKRQKPAAVEMTMSVTSIDFETAFAAMPMPAFLVDRALVIAASNSAFERLVGIDQSTMIGRPFFELFPPANKREGQVLKNSFNRVFRTGKPHHMAHVQYTTASAEGGERSWTTSNSPLFGPDGAVCHVLHCTAEITDLVQLRHSPQAECVAETGIVAWARNVENSLSSEHKRLQQLFQQAPGFFCVLQGSKHTFELANDAYYQLVGHREIIGQEVVDVLPEIIPQGFIEKLDRVYTTGERFTGRAVPILLQRTVGAPMEQRYIDMIYEPMFDANRVVTGIFVQGHDVTEAYALAQEIAYQAAHDPLTDLVSRREFTKLTRRTEGPGPHALFYMDIDHFKIVNDRCGHGAGDALLIQVAEALKPLCSTDQDLLARIGGDEFALVRRNCTMEAAAKLAEQLRRAVREIDFIWNGTRYGITLSIGLAGFTEAESEFFDSMLCLADSACFLAKEKGRNRVQLSLRDDQEIRQQQQDMDGVTLLKEAMREDRVVLYGQRIVGLQADVKHQRTFCEVLVRLRDPDGTIISPNAFIPAAERFGLIEELDRHIIRTVFAFIEARPSDHLGEICYFVNLSGITLSAPGFSDFIETVLTDHPSALASQVCFEVTETAAVSNINRTSECMHRLIKKGFSFALDDFGSGMASFAYLDRLPVQYVKIDGDIIKGMAAHPAKAIIVDAVAKIARIMNLRTVAESVECREVIPQLETLGIDYLQGYALHRPEPLSSLIKLNVAGVHFTDLQTGRGVQS